MSKRLRESVLAAKKGRVLRAKAESRSQRPPSVLPIAPERDHDEAFGAFHEMPTPEPAPVAAVHAQAHAPATLAAASHAIEGRSAAFVPVAPPKAATAAAPLTVSAPATVPSTAVARASAHAAAAHPPAPAPIAHAPRPVPDAPRPIVEAPKPVAAPKPAAVAPLPTPRPVVSAHAPSKAAEPKPFVPPPPAPANEEAPLPFTESASPDVFLSAPITTRPTSSAVPPPAHATPLPAAPHSVTAPAAAPSSAPLPVPAPPSDRAPLLKPEGSATTAPPLGSKAGLTDGPLAAPPHEPAAPHASADEAAHDEPPTIPMTAEHARGQESLGAHEAPKADEHHDAGPLFDGFFHDDPSHHDDAHAPESSGAPASRPSREHAGGGDDEDLLPSFMSPAAEARRARLRRIVAGFVGFAGLIALAVVGKAIFSPSKTPKPIASAPQAAPAPSSAQAAVAPPPASGKPAPTEAKPEASAAPSAAPAADSAKPADSAAPAASAEPEASAAPDPAKAAALEKETLSLLNRGKTKDAIAKAREAIAADPSQAMPYLYLGSALQDSGQWKQGIEAYSECVRNATKGPVHECRQMGGRK